jgi:hypothetical protein
MSGFDGKGPKSLHSTGVKRAIIVELLDNKYMLR